jgi:hypothetical protein
MVPLIGLFFDKFGWRMPFGMSLTSHTLVLMSSFNRSSVVYRRIRFDWTYHGTSHRSDCPFVIRFINERHSLCWIYSDSGQRSYEDGDGLWCLVIVRGM